MFKFKVINRFFIVIFFFVINSFSLVAFAKYSESNNTYTLARLVDIGLSISPEIQSEKAKIQKAITQIEIEKGGYWPSISVSAGPAHGLYGDLSYDASLIQTLYDWGKVESNVDSAVAEKRKQMQSLLISRSNVSLEIIETCFDIYSNREKLKSIKKYKSDLNSIYSLVEDRTRYNFSDKSEVYKIKKYLAYSDEQLATILGDLNEAERTFRLILNLSPDTLGYFVEPLDIIEKLSSSEELENTILHSPKYMKAQEDINIAKADVNYADASLKPDLLLQAQSQKREVGGALTEDSSVAIRLSMNLNQGLSNFYQKDATQQQVEAAKWNLQSVKRDLERDYTSNRENRIALKQRIDALKQQVKQSSNLIKSYKDQFTAGLTTVEDLVNSEYDNFQLTQQLINATSEYQLIPYRTASNLGLLNKLLYQKESRELH